MLPKKDYGPDLLTVCMCKNMCKLDITQTNVQRDLLTVCSEDCIIQMSLTVHTVDSAPLP